MGPSYFVGWVQVKLVVAETEMGYEKQVKKIRRFMGDLLNYFEVADVILEELLAKHPEISKEVLEAVCLAWQWGKKKVKAKESSRKRYCQTSVFLHFFYIGEIRHSICLKHIKRTGAF